MSKIPTREEFLEHGIGFYDYCEKCGKGDVDFQYLDDGVWRHHLCLNCDTVTSVKYNLGAQE